MDPNSIPDPPSSTATPIVSLKARLVRAFVLIGTVLVVLIMGITLLITERMVDAVETVEAKRAAERVTSVEQAKAELLRSAVNTYARAYARADAVDAWALDHADIDGVLVVTAEDRIRLAAVATRALPQLAAGDASPLALAGTGTGLTTMPAALVEHLRNLPGSAAVRASAATGLTWVEWEGVWLHVAIGIVADPHTPSNGDLVYFFRIMDARRLATRSLQSGVDYRIAAFDATEPAIGFDGEAAILSVPLDDAVLGTTAMAVARHPYDLSVLLQQIQAVTVLQQVLLLAALIFLLIRLLSVQVLDRVRALHRDVEALRHGVLRRFELRGPRDELALLAEDFVAIYQALDRTRSEWRRAAMCDPLTGLGNRAALQARLDLLFSAGRRWPSSLYLLDLDDFKTINDIHGHATGDALLVTLAQALVACLGERAEVYRLGGDEYAIIVHEGDDLGDEALAAIRKVDVRDALGQPLRVRASLGRAMLQEDVRSPGDWLRRADIAMYEAKRAGGNRVVEYLASMHQSLLERESIERLLRRALDEARIDVAFQPIVSAADGSLTAVEALARWHDVERGHVPPARFVPVAEEAGLSADLDLLVLKKSLPLLVALRARVPNAVLQVNLAPPSLLEAGLVERIDTLLRDAGLPSEALLLEVTESALAADPAIATAVVAHLRSLGLRIALDDFGTGYSSLARLAELKPSALKIDGRFVRDIDGDGGRIIRSILGLAQAFGLHVTAEFVETARQRDSLCAAGCDALQGYGIAEPMPAEALLAWVAARVSPEWP